MIHLRGPFRQIAFVAVVALLASAVSPAFGDQISDKKAQADAVQAQIEALDTKAEIATERYNTATDRLDSLDAKVHSTEKRIRRLKSQTNDLQTALNGRVVEMYTDPLGFLEVLLETRTFEDFNTVLGVLTNISTKDAKTIGSLKQAKKEAQAADETLREARTEAAQRRSEIAEDAEQVKEQLSARRNVLDGLNSDVKRLIAEKEAAEAAAAAEARQRYLAMVERQKSEASAEEARQQSAGSNGASHKRKKRGSGDSGTVPAGPKGAQAVAWAEKALGSPYEWAADGPDSFDCSGLTMWAYKHVGVSLPHSSREQIHVGTRVSKGDLEPGDLVFFGSPIHHVGMYVGGGQFIEAPYTGANVRIRDLDRDDYAGACRPYQ